ncbi:MAG: phospho-N-acetylmuramoyl-pentapeptide-transferase, partial [Candidatus Omnitrophica bacterium]|nr:phospho-N-acetylmuramoyl-pentapeptide-transferase [Candidatus Omnitrophota bacterium]
MLYNLLYPLHEKISFLNLFRYITFRAIMAALTAFLLSLIFGPMIIRKLKAGKIGEKVIKGDSKILDGLHNNKCGTPTMGGIFVIIAIVLSTVLWADISNHLIQLALLSTVWLGVTGFIDDYLKQVKKKSKGLTVASKLTSQIILGLILGVILYVSPEHSTRLELPFFKGISWDLGLLYIIFVILVLTGTSNAVNLTDGLDGLAIGCVTIVAFTFSILSYVTGNIKFASYLLIPYIRGSGELTVFCSSILGAGLGFLWFNCYPASI